MSDDRSSNLDELDDLMEKVQAKAHQSATTRKPR